MQGCGTFGKAELFGHGREGAQRIEGGLRHLC
jgi:hypothetical protein